MCARPNSLSRRFAFPLSFLIHLHLHSPTHRLPVALLSPVWNVNCMRRAIDFPSYRDAHAYRVWKEQRAVSVSGAGAGVGVVMAPDPKTKGNGPGQWTDLATSYYYDFHRRAWRLWHEQQDLMWNVVYTQQYN